MSEPDFWNKQESAQQMLQEVKTLRGWIEPYDKLDSAAQERAGARRASRESPDAEMEAELDAEIESLETELDSFELKTLLRGEDDFRDAQVEISAGAGGTEAQDWASDAHAHVHALGGAKRIRDRAARRERRRRSGHQGRSDRDSRAVRVRIPARRRPACIVSFEFHRSIPQRGGTRALLRSSCILL